MEDNFKVLSIKEEEALSLEDRCEYYKQLREYVLKRKLTNTTPGATTIAPRVKKGVNKIATAVIKLFTNKNIEIVCDGQENIPDGPVIFALAHQGVLDNFIWIPQIDKHSIILHHQDVNKLLIISQLYTGLVLIKKNDQNNAHNAKLDIIELLLKGHSITYFPEGTWNLSPNKLHLPLKFGFIDVAKKAGVPIIPVVHEYHYDNLLENNEIIKIRSRYGKPIYVKENDDLLEKLIEYEERISTIKYELIEEKGVFERKKINNLEYINYLKKAYKDIELSNVCVEYEREHIFTSNDEFYKFHHINDVPFDEEGNLLDTEEVRKIKALNKKHNI